MKYLGQFHRALDFYKADDESISRLVDVIVDGFMPVSEDDVMSLERLVKCFVDSPTRRCIKQSEVVSSKGKASVAF
jgi:hypothetical protein